MRYSEEQVDSTSKLMVDALYGIKTIDEAMEQMYSKEVKAYSNFKLYVKYLQNQLDGKTVHFATPLNWAKVHYKYLKNRDKIKFLDAMERQVEYDSQYGTPSHKLKKWIRSQRLLSQTQRTIVYPDEIKDNNLIEGAKKQVTVNAYERNSQARKECLQYYGTKCVICNFDFKAKYGEIGQGFIHVHHLKPLSEINKQYIINPIEDLRPVCPNCHAMLHKRSPAYSIEEVQRFIKKKDL